MPSLLRLKSRMYYWAKVHASLSKLSNELPPFISYSLDAHGDTQFHFTNATVRGGSISLPMPQAFADTLQEIVHSMSRPPNKNYSNDAKTYFSAVAVLRTVCGKHMNLLQKAIRLVETTPKEE